MKIRIVEVAYFVHVAIPDGGREYNQVVVHAGLHRRKLHLSFSISGPAESRETLPETLVDGIRQGLDYARKHTRVQDLVEFDREPVNEDD